MASVFAVIVTYKRAEILRVCLSSLENQIAAGLRRVHVICNSSDLQTQRVIEEFSGRDKFKITFQVENNVGPAGGFAEGIRSFLDSNEEYVWLMDDDIAVEAECLQTLLNCESGAGYIFPMVTTDAGKQVESFGWWAVLLHRSVVAKAGLPLSELFYWAEDTEYLQNRIMRINKVIPVRCDEARVNHKHIRNRQRPSWHYYYTVRNTLYYRTYIAGYTWYRFKRTLYLFPNLLYAILAKEENKIKKLGLFTRGVWDGLRGRIGKTIDPETNR